MSTPILDGIGTVVTALETTNVRVYYPAPTVPVPPCYVVRDANDWYSPRSIGASGQWTANLIIESFSDSKHIETGHKKAAEMQWAAMNAVETIAADRQAAAPRIVDLDAQGSAMAAALSITIQIKE